MGSPDFESQWRAHLAASLALGLAATASEPRMAPHADQSPMTGVSSERERALSRGVPVQWNRHEVPVAEALGDQL